MLVNTSLYAGPLAILLVLAGCLLAVSIVAVIRGQKRKLTAGRETLIGQTAVVRTPLAPEGTVLAEGELWHAIAPGARVDVGQTVVVTRVEGLTLTVQVKEDKHD